MVSGILALVTAASIAAGPVPQRPAADGTRYKLDIKIGQQIDLTAAGQGVQQGDVIGAVFLTLTTTDSAGTRLAHIVVDSMKVEGTGAMEAQVSQEMADGLKGATIDAVIKNGRVDGTPKLSAQNNVVMNLAAASVNVLFPGVNEKARGAKSYTDTLQNNDVNEAGTRNSQQVIEWTVNGTDGDALKMSGSANGTLTADMNGQQITGTTKSTISTTTPIGGPAHESMIDSTQDMTVLVGGLPDPVSIKVTTHSELTRLP